MKSTLRLLGIMAVAVTFLFACASAPEESEPVSTTSVPEKTLESVPSEPVVVWSMTQERVLYPDGTIDKTIEYVLDDQGRVLQSLERNSRNEVVYDRRYTYEKNRLSTMEFFDSEGLKSTTTYKILANEQEKETVLDANGVLLSTVEKQFENGLLLKSTAFDSEGIPQLSSVYTYDESKLIAVDYVLPDGFVEARFVRQWEQEQMVSEQTILPDESIESERQYQYENSVLVGESFYANGSLSNSVRFERDEAGNIIREIRSNHRGQDYEVIEREWARFEIWEDSK